MKRDIVDLKISWGEYRDTDHGDIYLLGPDGEDTDTSIMARGVGSDGSMWTHTIYENKELYACKIEPKKEQPGLVAVRESLKEAYVEACRRNDL